MLLYIFHWNTGILKNNTGDSRILSGLLYLLLVPVIFHRPEEEGAILQIWEFLHGKFYHLLLLLVLSFLNLSNGLVRLLERRTNPSLILAVSFMAIILIGAGLLMLPRCTVRYYLGRLFIYGYQCRMCYRFGSGRCIHYIHHFRISCHYPVDSDWRIRSDDINQFLCHVLHGKHLHL